MVWLSGDLSQYCSEPISSSQSQIASKMVTTSDSSLRSGIVTVLFAFYCCVCCPLRLICGVRGWDCGRLVRMWIHFGQFCQKFVMEWFLFRSRGYIFRKGIQIFLQLKAQIQLGVIHANYTIQCCTFWYSRGQASTIVYWRMSRSSRKALWRVGA